MRKVRKIRKTINPIRHFVSYAAMALAAGMVMSVFHASDSAAKPLQNAGIVKTITIQNAGNGLLINKKEKKKLKVKIVPKSAAGQKVEWKSSKKTVVSVNQKGVIRGKKFGRATITAQAMDGSGKKAKVRVQVGRKVTGIALSAQNVNLDIKKTTKLQAKVSPANATKRKLSYRSSNTSIATVSSAGTVYGRSKGKTVITASAKDGSGKRASCRVQVIVPSRSVLVDVAPTGTKLEAGQKMTISAAVQPADVSNKGLRYSSTNPRAAKVTQSGVVTGLEPGTTTIRIDAADGRSSATVELEVYKVELKDKMLIAHRGFSSEAPENTTVAFELAVKRGFYGVECDIRKTFDDNFVIMHDADLNRMCGRNLTIANMDLTQIKNCVITSGANVTQYPGLTVPTLEEYLEILAQSETVHPFIELKEELTEEQLRKIVKKVENYGLLERTYFISVYQTNLLSLKEMSGVNPDFLQYVYGAEDSNRTDPVTDDVIRWCIANAIDLDAKHTLITASDVYRMHEAGRKVNVWTVNLLEKAYELVTNANVDMVTTEYYLNS